jgi:hypothetical protein
VLAVVIGVTMLGGIALSFCGSYHGIRAAFCRRTFQVVSSSKSL